MVFGKLFSFIFGGIAGAYGMHQYIYSEATKGKFPDWNKISTDAQYGLNRMTVAIQRAINDEETQKALKKAKKKGM